MPVRLTVSVTGLPEAFALIDKVQKALEDDTDEMALEGLHSVAKVFDRNFASEGGEVGGWTNLAQRTVREREQLGIGGAHPILVRYEDLRDYTATFLQSVGASATFVTADPEGGTLGVQVSTSKGLVNVLAGGTKALQQYGTSDGHVPARPYWFVNANVMAAARKGVVTRMVKTIKGL